MLEEIFCVSGRPGLFRLISKGKNMLIVESLLNHKRMPVYLQNKITPLDKIAIYAESNEVSLSLVFSRINKKEEGHEIDPTILNADNDILNDYFRMIFPDYDKKRVYPSHIKKILLWYNLLVKERLMDFEEDNRKLK